MGVRRRNGEGGNRRGRLPGATVWASVLLVLVVIAASATAGRPELGRARWRVHVSAHHSTPQGSTRVPKPARSKPPQGSNPGASSWGFWVLVVIGTLICLFPAWVLWRLWRARRAPLGLALDTVGTVTTVSSPEPEPEAEVLLTGIELALAALEEEREPGDAIVRAWLGLEATAQESGIRRGVSETPTEFTARVMRSAFADDTAIGTLLRLYLRTRFSEHAVSAADVTEARDALAQLVENWRDSPRGRLAREMSR